MKGDIIKNLSDSQLINEYLNGNNIAFDELYSRYKKPLYAYLNKMLPGQHAVADDLFQQTWIKIINQLPKYQDKQRFLGWAFRIAHNLSIDYFRKGKREVLASNEVLLDKVELETQGKSPLHSMDRIELKKAIDDAVKVLPDELKEVFLLRQNGVTFKEISNIQKCSLNTAIGRMQYAMKNLQKILYKWKENHHDV